MKGHLNTKEPKMGVLSNVIYTLASLICNLFIILFDSTWLFPLINFLIILPKNQIPLTENLDPISLLIDNATVATWNNEELPSDRMSTENATILTNCERWPLMIDPQLQGVKWIRTREGSELKVVRLGQKG